MRAVPALFVAPRGLVAGLGTSRRERVGARSAHGLRPGPSRARPGYETSRVGRLETPFLCAEKHLFSNVPPSRNTPVNLPSALSERMLSERFEDRSVRTAARSVALVLCLALHARPAAAQSLRGSRASLDLQNRIARQHDFTYIDTPSRVRFFAEHGWLVKVEPNEDFELHAVSFAYARPEVELFIRRLSSQYRHACGERLVITSLTRPTTRQPRNASDRSVHPTGMALDARYSWNRNCRTWLEDVLTSLERQGVLEATLERRPRHYHVALFPTQYASYVETLVQRQAETAPETLEYRVRNGDSLWRIAREHGISVDDLKNVNGIRGSRIFVGQLIDVPLGS